MNKILFLGLLFIIFGCSHAEKKEEKKLSSHVLRINFQDGEVTSFHPQIGMDFRLRSLQTALYEGLTRVNLQGIPEAASIEGYEISPKGTVYTFHLRPSFWSNGEAVTASHFESAWKSALTPGSPCMRADLFYVIKNAQKAKKGEVSIEDVGIKALSPNTLQVELENPTPYFLELVASPIFSPLYSLEESQSVFNGPFMIGKHIYDQTLQLCPNPYYWDKSAVSLERIEISFIKEPLTALALYEKGELDWIGSPFSDIPLEAIPSFAKQGVLSRKEVSRIFWIYCNTDAFPLHSSNMRKALAYALDREAIAEYTLQGQAPACSPLPNSLSLIKDDALPLHGDLVKARAYLKSALDELNLTLENFPPILLSHSHISGQKQLAEAIQSCWSTALGIPVEIKGSEWNVFFSDMSRGQYQVGGCIKSAFFKDPAYHLELLKEKQLAYNVARWENALYKTLLDEAAIITDAAARKELLKKAETLLMDEMPVIPIYSEQYQYVLPKEVTGVFIHDLGHVDFKWCDVIR